MRFKFAIIFSLFFILGFVFFARAELVIPGQSNGGAQLPVNNLINNAQQLNKSVGQELNSPAASGFISKIENYAKQFANARFWKGAYAFLKSFLVPIGNIIIWILSQIINLIKLGLSKL